MITNKTVFFVVGILLLILGVFMLIPYGIQILYKENQPKSKKDEIWKDEFELD